MKDGYISQRTNGSWEVALPDPSKAGGYRRKGGFPKKSLAQAYYDRHKAAVHKIQVDGNAKGDILLNEFFREYLNFVEKRLSFETHKTYSGVIKDFNLFRERRYPGVQYLYEMNSKILEDYMDWLRDTGKLPDDLRPWIRRKHKSTTINNHIKVFKAMFNKAIDWGYLQENPTKRVTLVNVDDEKIPVTLDTPEKQKLFFDRCRELKPEFYPHYFVMAKMGLRFGEMATLQWNTNIDFKNHVLKVIRTETFSPKGRGKGDRKPKERFLPMTADVEKILKALPHISEFVFLYKNKPIKKREKAFRRWLIEIVEGTPLDGMTKIHELRHTAGDQLSASGFTAQQIQRFLGHSDIKTTMRYIRVPGEQMKQMAESLSNFGKTTHQTTQKKA